jgi:hypothetical protein
VCCSLTDTCVPITVRTAVRPCTGPPVAGELPTGRRQAGARPLGNVKLPRQVRIQQPPDEICQHVVELVESYGLFAI